MSDNTALGDRMKRYEAAHRAILPRRTYTLGGWLAETIPALPISAPCNAVSATRLAI